jgi:hypothetical protein
MERLTDILLNLNCHLLLSKVIYPVGADSTKSCQRSFDSEMPMETEMLEKAAQSLRFLGLVKKPEKMEKTDRSRVELDQMRTVRIRTCFVRVHR